MLKIDDLPAGHAVHVMVVVDIGIEAFGTAEDFHHIDDPQTGERQKRAVDRIERNTGEFPLDGLVHHIRRGMLVRPNQRAIDGNALRGHFKIVLTAGCDEALHAMLINIFLHVALK